MSGTPEPGLWGIVRTFWSEGGETFNRTFVNDGDYWWPVGPDAEGHSWEQVAAEGSTFIVLRNGEAP